MVIYAPFFQFSDNVIKLLRVGIQMCFKSDCLRIVTS